MDDTRGVSEPVTDRKKIYIDTGNLLHCTIGKQCNYLPQEEAAKGFKFSVCLWKKNKGEDGDGDSVTSNDGSEQSHLIISGNPACVHCSPREKRQSYRIIVKLLLYSEEQTVIEDAIDTVLKRLDTTYLDTLILALPSKGKDLTRDRIRRVWSLAEQSIRYHVKDLGMSDLDTDQLIDLHSFAKIKPTTNQINMELCCAVPEEMNEFAHDHNIKLLTHGDPVDFLPVNCFQEILKESDVKDPENWQRLWVARYTIIQQHKAIVLFKGYILSSSQYKPQIS